MARKANATEHPCKTLIVEDDAAAAHALVALLTKKGYQVETAGSVGDALVGLQWQPRCVILDLMLPDGNGVTVLRRVRKAGMPIKVAIVTGMHDPFGIDEITDLKPDAVFEKPLDVPKLMKWLQRAA
jgi:DNA-binding response OmpR family regulator